jgi:hypothetical protein
MFCVCSTGGFHITTIHCDNEFCPFMIPVLDCFQVKINFTAAQEHVPEAEHNNQVIKEKSSTTLIIKMLVTESGKSNNYSPCMIMRQKNLDDNQHCRYAFGSYVQAHDGPTPLNSKAP